MLCIGCLKTRMGRRLTPGDFKRNPKTGRIGGGPKDGNDPHFPDYRRSDRFRDRVREDERTEKPSAADDMRRILDTPDSPWVVGETMTRDEFMDKVWAPPKDER